MIYCGKRGSGKTVRLLRQVEALIDDGIIPVILSANKDLQQSIKYYAENLRIDTDKIIFLSATDLKTKPDSLRFLRDTQNYRVFIDELEYFIADYFNIRGTKFYSTIDAENVKMLYRGDWDKNYSEDKE